MNFIDTHSHLYLDQFAEDIDDCIERCREKSVIKVVLPNIDSGTIQPMLDLEKKNSNLFIPLMGLHPTHVKENFEQELQIVIDEFKKRDFRGIGEIGIDLYWDKTFYEEQKTAFKKQVNLAIEKNLPFVIHARESYDEILEVLIEINSSEYNGIFHAFSGSLAEANKVIEMGFSIGIGGVSTFKNSHLHEVIPNIDLNHIVLETDSPYLAPVPYRGKRNESSYIPVIAARIAEIKEVDIQKVASTTTENACRIFKI